MSVSRSHCLDLNRAPTFQEDMVPVEEVNAVEGVLQGSVGVDTCLPTEPGGADEVPH